MTVVRVTRAHGEPGFVPETRRCRRREGFEGRKEHRGEFRFATEGNAVNPRIGSVLKYGREVVEEETVEVVRNHGDGSRAGVGSHAPMGIAAARLPETVRRTGGLRGHRKVARTPRLERWRGDLWTTP